MASCPIPRSPVRWPCGSGSETAERRPSATDGEVVRSSCGWSGRSPGRFVAPVEEVDVSLFVVRHQHVAERCPAEDPNMGATLLNYLSRPNVAGHGVDIRGEAVVQGEHTLYLIVEAADEGCVRGFMEPFAMAGSVDVYPASTCARVV